MGGMEMFASSLLPPFIVLTGAYQGRLAKSWAEYDGQAFVAFQPKHWFDKNIMKDWLDCVRALYPGKKVGLILDRSSIHTNDEIVDYMEKLGFVVEFIHAGMTSIEQPCDLYLNKPLKSNIRERYYSHKAALKIPTGGKCPVSRELLVQWVEESLATIYQKQVATRDISRTFRKCGMDPFDDDKDLFSRHLEKMSEQSVYNSLIQNLIDNQEAQLLI